MFIVENTRMSLFNKSITPVLNKLFTRNINVRKIKNWYAKLSKPIVLSAEPPYSHITQIGDPVLRRKCDSVDPKLINSNEIKFLIRHLKLILNKYDSVGLAAPQIGIPFRVFVMEFNQKKAKEFSNEVYKNRKMSTFPFTAFINPELRIVDYNKITLPEACESVKGFAADVTRYAEVEVKAFNENGEEILVKADGWTARIIQHEMDHLDGKMYTDIMNRKSLCCTCWQDVNDRQGKIELPFSPS